MSAESSAGKLKQVERDLLRLWNETRLFWRDENSRRFEKEVIEPLLTKLRATQSAMGRIAVVLRNARRDCE